MRSVRSGSQLFSVYQSRASFQMPERQPASNTAVLTAAVSLAALSTSAIAVIVWWPDAEAPYSRSSPIVRWAGGSMSSQAHPVRGEYDNPDSSATRRHEAGLGITEQAGVAAPSPGFSQLLEGDQERLPSFDAAKASGKAHLARPEVVGPHYPDPSFRFSDRPTRNASGAGDKVAQPPSDQPDATSGPLAVADQQWQSWRNGPGRASGASRSIMKAAPRSTSVIEPRDTGHEEPSASIYISRQLSLPEQDKSVFAGPPHENIKGILHPPLAASDLETKPPMAVDVEPTVHTQTVATPGATPSPLQTAEGDLHFPVAPGSDDPELLEKDGMRASTGSIASYVEQSQAALPARYDDAAARLHTPQALSSQQLDLPAPTSLPTPSQRQSTISGVPPVLKESSRVLLASGGTSVARDGGVSYRLATVSLASQSATAVSENLPSGGARAAGILPLKSLSGEEASVRLGDLIGLLEREMDRPLFVWLKSSASAEKYVTFATLRAAGIDVNYDPATSHVVLSVGSYRAVNGQD